MFDVNYNPMNNLFIFLNRFFNQPEGEEVDILVEQEEEFESWLGI